MPDIDDLLDRTTPDDLPSLSADDLADLARRADGVLRRRRQRKQAAAAGIVGIAAAAALVVGLMPSGSSDDDTSAIEIMPAGPNGEALTEPVGTWAQATAPPFSARNHPYGGRLGDGRMVVWGGESSEARATGGEEADSPAGLTDGGIYDPATDSWEPIPPAPLPPVIAAGLGAQLADGRLAVVGSSADGALHAAVYDIAERRWTEAPAQDDVSTGVDGAAWDGETLALVRLGAVSGDTRGVDEPVTLRWDVDDDRWTAGAPAPLEVRSLAGSAFDGSRLALWGGTTSDLGAPDFAAEGTVADGAIYDLAADRWTGIAGGPLDGRVHPALAWVGGDLVVGGGRDGLGDASRDLVDVASYDPATQTWSPRPAAPDNDGSAARVPLSISVGESEGTDQTLVADPIGGANDAPQWFYGPDGEWEQAPLPRAQRLAGFWVATSPSRGNPGDEAAFSLQVRVTAGRWLDAAPAPYGNRDRSDTTVVSSGNVLLVIGGHQGADLDPATEAWVFDLAG